MNGPWPSPRTVALAVAGRLSEVMMTKRGPARVIRSADPEVIFLVASRQVACVRCSTYEGQPASPASRGLNGKAEALLEPGTSDHALFLLTWLHAFSAKHEGCRAVTEGA